MSQANYYLQKFKIDAQRFAGNELLHLKIKGLLKNDVKVCSYITLQQCEDLLTAFEKKSHQKQEKCYTFSEIIKLDFDVTDQTENHKNISTRQRTLKPNTRKNSKSLNETDNLFSELTKKHEKSTKNATQKQLENQEINKPAQNELSPPKINEKITNTQNYNIELNTYKIENNVVVALPDINKAIKIATVLKLTVFLFNNRTIKMFIVLLCAK